MKCYFCQQECVINKTTSVISGLCSRHEHVINYYMWADEPEGALEWVFNITYKEKLFSFSYGMGLSGLDNGVYFDLSALELITMSNGDEMSKLSTILELDFIPDITPENALDKLPTLLVFS
jgi:hypothetical protein